MSQRIGCRPNHLGTYYASTCISLKLAWITNGYLYVFVKVSVYIISFFYLNSSWYTLCMHDSSMHPVITLHRTASSRSLCPGTELGVRLSFERVWFRPRRGCRQSGLSAVSSGPCGTQPWSGLEVAQSIPYLALDAVLTVRRHVFRSLKHCWSHVPGYFRSYFWGPSCMEPSGSFRKSGEGQE